MSVSKRALITGITGQDGRYLSEFLLTSGYQVCGLIRGQSNPKASLVHQDVELVEGDLTDQGSLDWAVNYTQPSEIYNLGAVSHVGISFKQPELTAEVTGLGCLRLLEAMRKYAPEARFYQASTSELFGDVRETPQTEETPFYPRSPYGTAKAFAHHSTVNYREAYNLHASCGILFNHESEIRGYEFITRKVTQGVARIKLGLQDYIELGNTAAVRDWGYAGDYVVAMWKMLQQETPSDYVIATGKPHTIQELLRVAFDTPDYRKYIKHHDRHRRPSEVYVLEGDATKAKEILGWTPKVSFEEMIKRMVEYDLKIEGEKVG